MIELAILVLFIILIIGVILVYKKYVNVVNVINDEQNRKYDELSKLVGSNNVNIKNNTKNAEEILDRDTVDVQILQEIINNNNNNVKTNQNNLNKYNFEDLNKIFSYDNGFIIGNSSSQINIGDNNIRLNVDNPSKIKVCNEQNECTGSNSFATLQSVLNNYPLLENDLQALTGQTTQTTQNAQTSQTTPTTSTTQTTQTTPTTQTTQTTQTTPTTQTTNDNIVVATNNTTSSGEPGIYFDKTTNIFYSNISIRDVLIQETKKQNWDDPNFDKSNIHVFDDRYDIMQDDDYFTLYEQNYNTYTGEIFKIINFSNIEGLSIWINSTDLDYEYILNLGNMNI